MSDKISDATTGTTKQSRRRRSKIVALMVVLLVLLLLLAGVSYMVVSVLRPAGSERAIAEAGQEDMEWVRSIYGWGPAVGEQLRNPNCVAVGPDGKIYTDFVVGDQIIVFNPDGSFERAYGPGSLTTTTVSPLKRPSAIDIDANGDIYVSDLVAGKVFVFAAGGRLVRTLDTGIARTVTVTADRVYVGLEGSVEVFDKQGESLLTIGKRGFGKDDFNSPDSIEVDSDGVIYVSDSLNGRLKAYSAEGELLWIFPSYGAEAKPVTGSMSGSGSRTTTGGYEFQLPRGIVLDGSGRLLVVDAFEFEIKALQLTKTGATTVKSWGREGVEDGRFAYPSDLDFDAERDWVVVADSSNSRLQILRLSGTGGATGLAAAYKRANLGPVWVCAIPLAILLLLLVVLGVMSRRTRKSKPVTTRTEVVDEVSTSGEE